MFSFPLTKGNILQWRADSMSAAMQSVSVAAEMKLLTACRDMEAVQQSCAGGFVQNADQPFCVFSQMLTFYAHVLLLFWGVTQVVKGLTSCFIWTVSRFCSALLPRIAKSP